MIHYRPFLNSDPPAIAEIWRSQPPSRGLVQPMSPILLEEHVLAKPYFDRYGLIVAAEGDRPVGFVHGGFGPSDDFSRLSTELGIICLLLVAPIADRDAVARELLARGEHYLRGRGARLLQAGGKSPAGPFYLGLYGGSELPGVLESDAATLSLYRERGYREVERRLVLRRELRGFRPPIDHRQMQLRRSFHIEATPDPPAANWWEACTLGDANLKRFTIRSRDAGPPYGNALFWDIEPLAAHWAVQAAGLLRLEMVGDKPPAGLTAHLLGESLRQLHKEGASLCEAHVSETDTAAVELYKSFGFTEVDQGVVLRKEASDST